jgi:hypothetical protein
MTQHNTLKIEVSTTDGRTMMELGKMFMSLAGQALGAVQVDLDRDIVQRQHDMACDVIKEAHRVGSDEYKEAQKTLNAEDSARADLVALVPGTPFNPFQAGAPAPPPPAGTVFPGTPLSDMMPPPAFPLVPTPPAPLVPGVELDSAGIPWDARIHSKSKAKLAKTAEWKLAKNIDKNLVTTVIAELKAVMASQVTPAAPGLPVQPVAPPAPPQVPTPPVIPTTPVVPAPPVLTLVPTPPAPPQVPVTPQTVAPAGEPPTTFPAFLQAMTAFQNAGQVTNEQILQVLNAYGIPNPALLNAKRELIPTVYQYLTFIASGAWTLEQVLISIAQQLAGGAGA